jgi:hypothetical protein
LKWSQEQLEQMVLSFLQQQHPQFKIKNATLEVQYDGERVSSWWIACEHANGDQSIMEDDQVLLLIGQQQGWKDLIEVNADDFEDKGFVLTVNGK